MSKVVVKEISICKKIPKGKQKCFGYVSDPPLKKQAIFLKKKIRNG